MIRKVMLGTILTGVVAGGLASCKSQEEAARQKYTALYQKVDDAVKYCDANNSPVKSNGNLSVIVDDKYKYDFFLQSDSSRLVRTILGCRGLMTKAQLDGKKELTELSTEYLNNKKRIQQDYENESRTNPNYRTYPNYVERMKDNDTHYQLMKNCLLWKAEQEYKKAMKYEKKATRTIRSQTSTKRTKLK